MSRDQNAGVGHIIKNENSFFEKMEGNKYLGTNLMNKNSIQEEITSRFKSGNAGYFSVQNVLSSSLLSRNINIKIYRSIIFPVVLYGCEIWSLTLREELTLRVFENRVLRRLLPPGYNPIAVNKYYYLGLTRTR